MAVEERTFCFKVLGTLPVFCAILLLGLVVTLSYYPMEEVKKNTQFLNFHNHQSLFKVKSKN